MCGFISGLSVVFHSSMCLFSCRYHTVLITTPLEYDLNSGSVLPPALIFFLRIALAISGHLWFHINLGIFFYFCEKCQWNFDRDCIESIDDFGQYGHFNNINSYNPQTQDIFPFVYVFFNFFYQYLVSVQIFHLVKFIPKYSIVFDAIGSGQFSFFNLFFILFFIINFYWSIVALQCCVTFILNMIY